MFITRQGHETSSGVLTYCIYELSQHEGIQIKARDSIKAVLKKHGNKLTYAAVQEMQYLDQCINGR